MAMTDTERMGYRKAIGNVNPILKFMTRVVSPSTLAAAYPVQSK